MGDQLNYLNPNSANNLPPDMWDDHPTALSPTIPPVTPSVSHPPISPTPHPPAFKSPHRNWWQWWLTLLLILLVTGGAGYLASRYWSNVANWAGGLLKNVPSTTDDHGTGINDDQVAWQPRVLISDLGLLSSGSDMGSNVGFAPVNLAKYYKVGEFISGPYDNGDLLIATLPIESAETPVRFYYFAKSNNNLVLLAKHSPDLMAGDGIDQSRFTIDWDYQIARLSFPPQLKNPRSDAEPLILDTSIDSAGDRWFDESLLVNKWQKVFIDLVWGDVYTDPLPEGTEMSSGAPVPQCGFYLQAPDGTIRTYKLTASILRNDVLQADVPAFVWADGTSSVDGYLMFDVDECKPTNLAAVVSNTLMDELISAANSDKNAPVYELKDQNHSILKELFKSASGRADNRGLTYQSFLDSHPIFFWQDSFGRLIKFQNKRYVALTGCD